MDSAITDIWLIQTFGPGWDYIYFRLQSLH